MKLLAKSYIPGEANPNESLEVLKKVTTQKKKAMRRMRPKVVRGRHSPKS